MLRFRYILKLPDDFVRRRQLMIKRRQYDERMANLERRMVNDHRLSCLPLWHHYEFRQAILAHLLHDHEVNLGDLQVQLQRSGHLAEHDEGSWFIACAIIIDYCLTGGQNLQNGSGLPDVKPKHRP